MPALELDCLKPACPLSASWGLLVPALSFLGPGAAQGVVECGPGGHTGPSRALLFAVAALAVERSHHSYLTVQANGLLCFPPHFCFSLPSRLLGPPQLCPLTRGPARSFQSGSNCKKNTKGLVSPAEEGSGKSWACGAARSAPGLAAHYPHTKRSADGVQNPYCISIYRGIWTFLSTGKEPSL